MMDVFPAGASERSTLRVATIFASALLFSRRLFPAGKAVRLPQVSETRSAILQGLTMSAQASALPNAAAAGP
jgi:hypothetical protein